MKRQPEKQRMRQRLSPPNATNSAELARPPSKPAPSPAPGPQADVLASRVPPSAPPRPGYFAPRPAAGLSAPTDTRRAGVLRRQCACGGTCEECQRGAQRGAPEAVGEVLRSAGQPLEPSVRGLLEPRFGQDLGQVRVHTDARAADSAREVDAAAYTVGAHVVFGSGRYAPGTEAGQRLLAHELAHTLQREDGAEDPGHLRISHPDEPGEREADRMARGVLEGGTVEAPRHTGAGVLHRAPPSPLEDEEARRRRGSQLPASLKPPTPTMFSLVIEGGKPYLKVKGIPKLGSLPRIPLDPRDVPGELRKLLPQKEEEEEPTESACPPERRTPNPVLCCEQGKKWFADRCEDAEVVDSFFMELLCRKRPDLCALPTPQVSLGTAGHLLGTQPPAPEPAPVSPFAFPSSWPWF